MAKEQTDSALIGCWRVKFTDMIVGRVVHLIGGLPEEYVVFAADGCYEHRSRLRPASDKRLNRMTRYRTELSGEFLNLDFWMPDLTESLTRCIYRIEGDSLLICVAGNHGERSTELRRDDERLWCVITMEKSKFRQKRKSSQTRANEASVPFSNESKM